MSRSTESVEDSVVAKKVDIADIPIIDFAPFLSGDPQAKLEVAQEIAEACSRIGFFYLTGHNVDQQLIADTFARSRDFYHLPLEEKAKAAATPAWYRGWIPMPTPKPLSRDSRLFEQYRIQADLPGNDEEDSVFYRANRWPEGMPAFQETCNKYYDTMLGLSSQLLKAFAIGLGLPEDRLNDYFHRPLCQLSLLYYIPLPQNAEIEVSNTVSHTDEGPFTILAQDASGGLEVKRRDGVWISAPPVEGAYVINVGDMLMWWSNGRYLSNYHRVKNRAPHERFSVPFFMNPDRDVVVSPLPELLGPDTPAQYEPVHVGRHLSRFYTALEKTAIGT